jgi:hypothetical protein
MTLLELRRLSDSVGRIPCDPGADLPAAVREFNASVTRFQELVVLVRNRIVVGEPGHVPAGAEQVRELAKTLVVCRPAGLPGWVGETAQPRALRASIR